MTALEIPGLLGIRVRLEPLEIRHADDLLRAAREDRHSYQYTSVPVSKMEMRVNIETLLGEGELGIAVPFAQVDNRSQRAVGMTRYFNIRSFPGADAPFATEIGGTWLADSAQRTGLNTEAKFLLLRHAFEVWRVVRVDLKTDCRNERSRAAITRLGASFEGVLRQWQPSLVSGEEGTFRDSAMFSVVASEWPGVQSRMISLMNRS